MAADCKIAEKLSKMHLCLIVHKVLSLKGPDTTSLFNLEGASLISISFSMILAHQTMSHIRLGHA